VDEEKLLEYVLAMVAITVIGLMAITGAIDPREAVNYILTIIGYVLGKSAVVHAYRAYKARRTYSL